MKSKWWLVALLVCLALAVLSPLASSAPDGLERVAEDQGFLALSGPSPLSVLSDYVFPGIRNQAAATMLAGVTGVLLLFAVAYGLARLVTMAKRRKAV